MSLLLMKDVENFQDDTTRKRKNCLDAFPFETLDEDLSTCELHDNASVRLPMEIWQRNHDNAMGCRPDQTRLQ